MIIRMKKSDYDAVVQYCLSGLPNESCGLIAGFVDGNVKVIEKGSVRNQIRANSRIRNG